MPNIRHIIKIPRVFVDNTGAKVAAPTGVLAFPTGLGLNPSVGLRNRYGSLDPTIPNPAFDRSVGSSLIFSVGGELQGQNPTTGQ